MIDIYDYVYVLLFSILYCSILLDMETFSKWKSFPIFTRKGIFSTIFTTCICSIINLMLSVFGYHYISNLSLMGYYVSDMIFKKVRTTMNLYAGYSFYIQVLTCLFNHDLNATKWIVLGDVSNFFLLATIYVYQLHQKKMTQTVMRITLLYSLMYVLFRGITLVIIFISALAGYSDISTFLFLLAYTISDFFQKEKYVHDISSSLMDLYNSASS